MVYKIVEKGVGQKLGYIYCVEYETIEEAEKNIEVLKEALAEDENVEHPYSEFFVAEVAR